MRTCTVCRKSKQSKSYSDSNVCKLCHNKIALKVVWCKPWTSKARLLKYLSENVGKRIPAEEINKLYPWCRRITEWNREWWFIEEKQVSMIRLAQPYDFGLKSSHATEMNLISTNYKKPRAKKLFKDSLIPNS